MADAEQVKLAAETYIYGYPLVYGLEEVANGVEGGGALPMQAPYNRYYVLQFIGAWTNNFAYIGRRATGTAEGEYLLTDCDYDGEVPDGMTVVAAPTGVFTIGGRVQVDEATFHALQDQFTLTPLSVRQGGTAPPEVAGVPKPDPRVGEELAWWQRFRVALVAFPHRPATSRPWPWPSDSGRPPATRHMWIPTWRWQRYWSPDNRPARPGSRLAKGSGEAPGGWNSALHLFD